MVMLVGFCLFFLFALYAHAAVTWKVGCRHWCWWLLERSLLLGRRRCLWFLRKWGPTILDRSAAIVWTLYGVKNRVLQVPIVGSFFFDSLGQKCCAVFDTSPQVCHEAGRICGGHDGAVFDQCIDVSLPLVE